jgi:protein-L-isoaspartate O-methyltransferase
MSRLVDWRPLAEALAADVRGKGYLIDPFLYKAFAETPRHVFVPTFRDYSQPGRWVTDADDDWLPAVYADEPLVTQVKPETDNPDAEWPTCSSSMPSLMADMIEELEITPGMEVLEIGTGTGYNAAILCHLLRDRHVSTIDVDPDLVQQARERLARLDRRPTFTATEQAYDRVLATHAVTEIPYEWVRLSRPGGVILTDLRSQEHNDTGVWAKLTVADDGRSAFGVPMPSRGSFMGARRTPEFADVGHRPAMLSEDERRQRTAQMRKRDSGLPPDVLEEFAFGLLVWRAIPGVNWWATDDQYGMNAPGGCWANVNRDGTVFYGGRCQAL